MQIDTRFQNNGKICIFWGSNNEVVGGFMAASMVITLKEEMITPNAHRKVGTFSDSVRTLCQLSMSV